MTDDTDRADRHILIIGAGPGLGASLASRFGREGFTVTVAGRQLARLEDLADELRGAGVKADTLVVDAGNPNELRSALTELAQRLAPDVVIYNAALMAANDLLTSDTDQLLNAYATDVVGAITTVQVFAPAMRGASAGTVLLSGGIYGVTPNPEYSTLSLGKAALRAAATLLHDPLKRDGVHLATVTIAGAIVPDTEFDPERIADTYWALHSQPAAEWTAETLFDGQ